MLFSLKDLISEYVHGKGSLNCHLRVQVIEKKNGFPESYVIYGK